MKKITILWALCLIVLSSCGSAKKDSSIPIELEFNGEISKYYSVANAVIKLEEREGVFGPQYAATIDFDLVRNSTAFVIDPATYNYRGEAIVGFGTNFDGSRAANSGDWCMFITVENSSHDHVGRCCGSASKLFEYYTTPGDTCHLKFDTTINDIYREGTVADCEQFIKGEQKFYFYLNGLLEEPSKPAADNSKKKASVEKKTNNNVAKKANSAGSVSIDEILDEFEKFVDSYIRLYKKAMNGDMSALTEYVSYLEQAESLSEKLEDVEDDFTTAQLNRYMKITQKMTEVLEE